MYRKTYLNVNLDTLENNIKNIREVYGDYKYFFGVVKGNAYAHGIEVIKSLIKGGVNYLAVSSLEEALEIRSIDKKIPVLVMEPIMYEGIEEAVKNNITITVDNLEYFKRLIKDKVHIKFHLKIDSGMNRFGIKNREEAKYISEHANDVVIMEGIFTHLSIGVGDIYKKHIANFKEITKDIDFKKVPIVHLDRSLTMEQHDKEDFANGVRLGLVMYGMKKQIYPLSWKRKLVNFIKGKKVLPPKPSKLDVKYASSFYTNVIEVKKVKKDEFVGYAGMSDENKERMIAIIPVGFADFAYIKPGMDVWINDKRYKIIVVNMDVAIIEADENIKYGDRVEIFGDNINIKEIASKTGENVYKVLLSITDRVPRVYHEGNKEYEVKYRRVGK